MRFHNQSSWTLGKESPHNTATYNNYIDDLKLWDYVCGGERAGDLQLKGEIAT